jgi:hypothetical protein
MIERITTVIVANVGNNAHGVCEVELFVAQRMMVVPLSLKLLQHRAGLDAHSTTNRERTFVRRHQCHRPSASRRDFLGMVRRTCCFGGIQGRVQFSPRFH